MADSGGEPSSQQVEGNGAASDESATGSGGDQVFPPDNFYDDNPAYKSPQAFPPPRVPPPVIPKYYPPPPQMQAPPAPAAPAHDPRHHGITPFSKGAPGAPAGGADIFAPILGSSGGKEVREGDWTCPMCFVNVFANKPACFRCQVCRCSGWLMPAAQIYTRRLHRAKGSPRSVCRHRSLVGSYTRLTRRRVTGSAPDARSWCTAASRSVSAAVRRTHPPPATPRDEYRSRIATLAATA